MAGRGRLAYVGARKQTRELARREGLLPSPPLTSAQRAGGLAAWVLPFEERVLTRNERKHLDRTVRLPFLTRRNVLVLAGIAGVFVAIAVPAIGAIVDGVTP
jgi:hypothetical protein